jgi:putative lipoic acid-binding regulatory protein
MVRISWTVTILVLLATTQSTARRVSCSFVKPAVPPPYRAGSLVTVQSADGNLTIIEPPTRQHDMTDRFKYKVNALMGAFDPSKEIDTERNGGNIFNAMLTFPLKYSFNVVGRTEGDDTAKETFIGQVKAVVIKTAGDDGSEMAMIVTPRGKKFTKITIEVQVESSTMITSIYKDLEQLDMSIMQF